LKTIEELLGVTNNKLDTQSTLVVNLNSQITNYKDIIQDLSTKSNIQKDLSKDLEEALRKANRRTKLYKLGTTIGAVALGILIIQ
jgi:uncharacterized protein YycO